MLVHNSRAVAILLAGWYLLLGAAGSSLHVLMGEHVRPCSHTVTARCCDQDHCGLPFAAAGQPERTERSIEAADRSHDPQNCLLCRWLSQPRGPVCWAEIEVAQDLLVWQGGEPSAVCVATALHPYAARAPPSLDGERCV